MPLAHPPEAHEYAITPAGAIVAVTRAPDWGSAASPNDYHEVYLRLFGLDLESIDAMQAFLNRYGPLGISGGRNRLGFDWHASFYPHVEPGLKEADTNVSLEIADWDRLAGDDAHYGFVQTLAEFRWQAHCIRDLVRAWRWFREDVAVGRDEWESPVWVQEDLNIPIPIDQTSAAVLLRQGIRSGLVPFHPELRIATSDDDPRWHEPYGGGLPYYFICCLELYNHIVQEAALTDCANEQCGRLFVEQEGRARHGQHRKRGVKYCSAECARSQAQREYRRRKATHL